MRSPRARLFLLAALSATAIAGAFLLSPRSLSASTSSTEMDSAKVRVFPNPWRVDKDNAQGVMFDQFPAGATIKIFTIAAEKVRVLRTDGTEVLWDLRNDGGDNVASGVYLYIVDSSLGQVKGKVVIIR